MYFGSNVQPLNLYTGVTICEKIWKKNTNWHKNKISMWNFYYICSSDSFFTHHVVRTGFCEDCPVLYWQKTLTDTKTRFCSMWNFQYIYSSDSFFTHHVVRTGFCEDCPVLYWQSNPGKCGGRVECNDLKKF